MAIETSGSTSGARSLQAKQEIRSRIWELLEHEHAAPLGVAGHIPDFVGSDAAAAHLSRHEAWRSARVVKAVPDLAQFPVRVRALEEGKRLYMASPKLATTNPFYYLDPELLTVPPHEAAAHRTAAKYAQPVGLSEMPPVDLIVCGSVAVNREGARLGKGAGYSDIEVALLQEAGLIGSETLIVTTVHSLQVVDEELPETEHDFRVDLIVTPDGCMSCTSDRRRPSGIHWESLDANAIAAIPVLAARRSRP